MEKLNKKILIGKNTDNEAIILEIDTIGLNQPKEHFSICGETYDMSQILTDKTGKERARDYLEGDDYLWKDAVENNRTKKGFRDWNQEVLDVDGWEHVLGDIEEIGDGLYCQMGSCGQINMDKNLEDWDTLLIDQNDLEKIIFTWDNFHLFDVKLMNGETLLDDYKGKINEVVQIFKKYPEYEPIQLKQFVRND